MNLNRAFFISAKKYQLTYNETKQKKASGRLPDAFLDHTINPSAC